MVTSLLDTNILVDLIRGYAPATAWIATQQQPGISRIVYMEVVQGAPDKNKQRQALKFLQNFVLAEPVQDDFEWATRQLVQFHLAHNVGMVDCLIAASAHRLNMTFFTRNLKHFSPLLGPLVQQPY